VADTVPIDIPSEKTPFTPRLALPPVPEPGSAPMAPPDVAPAPESKGEPPAKSDAKTDAKAEPRAAAADGRKAPAKSDAKSDAKADAKTEPKADTKADTKADIKADSKADSKADARTAAEAQRAREILEGKAATDKQGRFGVQAAALSSEAAANELSARLRKAGLAPYTERVQTQEGPRWRVRLGPYSNRDEAEKVRARLRALDVNATLVGG
jgi:DedD protein